MNIPTQDPQALQDYCMPFIKGTQTPVSAAQLMASRYVAYTLCEIDYLVATTDPEQTSDLDLKAIEQWSKSSTWLGLEILDTVAGGSGDNTGEVEFIARYSVEGREAAHHERSSFKRIAGTWHYVEGSHIGDLGSGTAKAPVRVSVSVGRNEPCPCGSGKKYKKCCGAAR